MSYRRVSLAKLLRIAKLIPSENFFSDSVSLAKLLRIAKPILGDNNDN